MSAPRSPGVFSFPHAPADRPTKSPADADLIDCYASVRDEVAFVLLVQRHGPMVLGVCRRILGNAHDAEDAFQEVFLVLARKAGSLRSPEAVSSWLYGVARRIARKARTAAARRRKHEAAAPPARAAKADAAVRELIHEEVARLPGKHRAPVVLCYFEGKTKEQAARELRLPAGTVSARLARARTRLRRRLVC